jgi:hypothetical protein
MLVRSAQPPGLALRLHQDEDVVLPDGTFHVPDDRAGLVVKELHADLSHTTTRSSTTKDFDDFGEFGLFGLLWIISMLRWWRANTQDDCKKIWLQSG